MNTEKFNVAFTIQIPKFKKVNYNGLYIPFGNLAKVNQEAYLRTLLNKIIADLKASCCESGKS